MRIVHEIYSKQPQTTANIRHAYATPIAEPPTWSGAHVEVLICDVIESKKKGQPAREGDTIYIEGDLDGIRAALREVLAQLDFAEEFAKKKLADQQTRAVQCGVCRCWHDSRYEAEGHADGRGMTCFGDGLARMGGWYVTIQGDPKEVVHTQDLKKGQRFLLTGNQSWVPELRNHVFEALTDATEEGVLVRRP